MADFQPFEATLYNPTHVDFVDVITQPYDKITPQMQEAYYRRSPYNAVRVILGKESPQDSPRNNRYTRARDFLYDWKKDGLLKHRPFPAFYLLEQTFEWDRRRFTRRGLIGRIRLSPFSDGIVLPHERTHRGPKADRMALLREIESHWEQIFLLATEKMRLADYIEHQHSKLIADFTDEMGVTNRLWEITGQDSLIDLHNSVWRSKLYIADGHHRYETALSYRDERRRSERTAGPDAPYEFVMATVVEMADPGLLILPTHRLVKKSKPFQPADLMKKIEERFIVQPIETSERMMNWINAAPAGEHRIGLAMAEGKFYQLRLRDDRSFDAFFVNQPPLWGQLDVALAHILILDDLLGIGSIFTPEEALEYYRYPNEVIERLQRHEGSLGIFLKQTPVNQVKAIADAASRMPEKSTDFYPKLPSGIVIYDLNP